MRTFPFFAILFFAVPLIEIYLLIHVGSVIGTLPTILLVVFTAVLGAFLLRQQGLSTFARFQRAMSAGEMPATALLEGLMLLVGGALLMTPGFFTDAIGFACLLPFSRQWLAKALLKRATVAQFHSRSSYHQRDNPGSAQVRTNQSSGAESSTLEGEYTRKD